MTGGFPGHLDLADPVDRGQGLSLNVPRWRQLLVIRRGADMHLDLQDVAPANEFRDPQTQLSFEFFLVAGLEDRFGSGRISNCRHLRSPTRNLLIAPTDLDASREIFATCDRHSRKIAARKSGPR